MVKKNSEVKFSIINETKGRLYSLPFNFVKNKILGKKYDLSLVFIGEKKIHSLNKKYRKMDFPTDILSFVLSKKSGEIFICPKIARSEAKKFHKNEKDFIFSLFIHGLVHLLGFNHGNKMEKMEAKYGKIFKI